MGNKCAQSLTTLELLDAIEAGITVLKAGGAREEQPAAGAPDGGSALRGALQGAGMSAGEFARLASVPLYEVESWTAGERPAPEWVPSAIRLIVLLTPSARRKLLYGQAGAGARPVNSHPFSRIEEL